MRVKKGVSFMNDRNVGSRMWFVTVCCAALLAVTASGAEQAEYKLAGGIFDVPLTVREDAGVARTRWPATFGVPLRPGLVRDVSELRLLDAAGNEVPCQFNVTSRYWSRDNSVRWVLLDFQADLPAGGRTVYRLTNDKGAAKVKGGVEVEEGAESVTVKVDELKTVISKKRCNLFETVSIGGKKIISAGEHDGPRATTEAQDFERTTGAQWNMHGWDRQVVTGQTPIVRADYFGDAGQPDEVVVERSGPMHTIVRVSGTYRPVAEGKGVFSQGVYNFAYRLHFYKGHDFVRVEHSVENSRFEQPQFVTKLLDHSLWTTPVLGSGAQCTFEGTNGVTVAEGKCHWVDVSGDGARVGVAVPVPGGDGQSALELSNGRLIVRPYSIYYGERHPVSSFHMRSWGAGAFSLDIGSRITYDIYYRFSLGQGSSLDALARGMVWPLFGFAPPAWYRDSGVWNMELDQANGHKLRRGPKDDPLTAYDPYSKDAIQTGVRDAWNFNSGGQHGNLSSLYDLALLQGDLQTLEKNLWRTKTAIDYFQWNYRGYGPTNDIAALAHQHKMILFGAKDVSIWGCRGLNTSSYLNGYKFLPDFEHYGFLWLAEHYYLWGDSRARESLIKFATEPVTFEWDVMFQRETEKGDWWADGKSRAGLAGKPGFPSLEQTDFFEKHHDSLSRSHYARIYSWMLYTPLQAYQATGDPVLDLVTKWQLRRLSHLQRLSRGIPEAWVAKRWDSGKARFYKEIPYPDEKDVTTYEFKAQQWMIAKTMMAFHEAYRTYGDEEILDNIWGECDYFLQVPWRGPGTGIPNEPLIPATLMGTNYSDKVFAPNWHMRTVQALALGYYYTGDAELKKRFDDYMTNKVSRAAGTTWGNLCSWVLSMKGGRDKAPDPVTDLKCVDTGRDTLSFEWTAPKAYGASGKAARYFLKYTTKPVTRWACVNNPNPPEDPWLDRAMHIYKPECWHPDFLKKDAWWMGTHVEGEPVPGAPGSREKCRVTVVKPFNYYGLPLDRMPKVASLPAGTYYFAVCSYDEDNNLSDLSNTVTVELR